MQDLQASLGNSHFLSAGKLHVPSTLRCFLRDNSTSLAVELSIAQANQLNVDAHSQGQLDLFFLGELHALQDREHRLAFLLAELLFQGKHHLEFDVHVSHGVVGTLLRKAPAVDALQTSRLDNLSLVAFNDKLRARGVFHLELKPAQGLLQGDLLLDGKIRTQTFEKGILRDTAMDDNVSWLHTRKAMPVSRKLDFVPRLHPLRDCGRFLHLHLFLICIAHTAAAANGARLLCLHHHSRAHLHHTDRRPLSATLCTDLPLRSRANLVGYFALGSTANVTES
mmetsp:Transcript_12580/g.24067  ORF Transcript_12580/g.24067 Transcript_12580/m.24067 type:complete len:281 (+) Transcript_12580:637-1479(+)